MFPKGTISPAWWGLAFVSYALASLVWAASANWSAVIWLGLWVAAFVVAMQVRSLYWIYVAFVIILAVNVGVAIMQWFDLGFQRYTVHSPAGLFGNSNYFACLLAVGVVIALSEKLYWFLPLGALGLWLAGSRGAMLAVGGTLGAWYWPRSKHAVMIILPLTIVAIVASSGARTDSIAARLGVWQDTLNHLTLFGSGWGTFATAYDAFTIHTNMTEFRAPHAYNDFLEMIFELGIGSIFLWILLGAAFEQAKPTERYILLCYCLLALTYFPLQIVGPLVAMALGHCLAERKLHGSLAPHQPSLPEHYRQRVGISRDLERQRPTGP